MGDNYVNSANIHSKLFYKQYIYKYIYNVYNIVFNDGILFIPAERADTWYKNLQIRGVESWETNTKIKDLIKY